jgi:hypothetical protein
MLTGYFSVVALPFEVSSTFLMIAFDDFSAALVIPAIKTYSEYSV